MRSSSVGTCAGSEPLSGRQGTPHPISRARLGMCCAFRANLRSGETDQALLAVIAQRCAAVEQRLRADRIANRREGVGVDNQPLLRCTLIEPRLRASSRSACA